MGADMKRRQPSNNRRANVKKDDRTKFDRWLDSMVESRSPIVVKFAEPPLPETPSVSPKLQSAQTIWGIPIMCDRYFVLVEMQEGQTFWFAKSAILSCAMAVAEDFE